MKFDPWDYLEKYGFQDGNTDMAMEAYVMRGTFLHLLSKEFERAGLPYEAIAQDVACGHNEVRIKFVWEGKYYWGEEAQTLPGFKEAMEAAVLQFRKEIPSRRAWRKAQDSKLRTEK